MGCYGLRIAWRKARTKSLDEFPLDNPPSSGEMAFGAEWLHGGGRLVAMARIRDRTAWLFFGGRHPIQVRKRLRREQACWCLDTAARIQTCSEQGRRRLRQASEDTRFRHELAAETCPSLITRVIKGQQVRDCKYAAGSSGLPPRAAACLNCLARRKRSNAWRKVKAGVRS
ncbi:hypothetical protein IE81DRAFT_326978 [Ceraceosorus guamensis]|uniref:Uncharacterized protein n=1 Tax=Ceraceosorus guamensis TaxID=1522189 RepID=A0A316VMZ2_9BASI|nr:hypothetical protein IE81DRAFT_326978 [Ceraceosorus guamensis]PWN38999.1 hypothetical protein IE81DRAFT_326978 [Ceraceosorus guamensis]